MTMMKRTSVGVLLVLCAWSVDSRNAVKAFRETPRNAVKAFRETALAAQPASASCDRECLRGKVTQLLFALVTHDVKDLPVADTLRVTEDAVEKPLARVGLV